MPFASLEPEIEIKAILLTQESNKHFQQNLKIILEKVQKAIEGILEEF